MDPRNRQHSGKPERLLVKVTPLVAARSRFEVRVLVIAVAGERLSAELVAENPNHIGPEIARRSVHQMSGWLTIILLRHGVERAGWHKKKRLEKSSAIHDALSLVPP
jgi:hypothetical protein